MSTVFERISHNLKKYRIARGISQHELSRQSKVSCCIINWMEAGSRKNITVKTLERLATSLNIKITDFFHGKE